MQAWLNNKPKDSELTNRDIIGGDLPEISEDYCHLPVWLSEIGTVGRGFDCLVPLSYSEIEAWARMTSVTLSRFEAVALRTMSACYAAISNDKDAECPIHSDEMQNRKDEAALATWKALAK